MSFPTRLLSALALLTLASTVSLAQQPRLAVTPARPQPGAIVRLTLSGATAAGDSIVAIKGTMAGEPLHFTAAGNGTFTAIGGVPVDSVPSLTARAFIAHASGRTDTLRAIVEPAALPPPTEALAVAPRFGQPMDSALEARVARESKIARDLGRRSHDTPKLWTTAFAYPRPSAITSKFGAGRKFNGRVTSRHLGVDFKGATGADVQAANRGVVALVDTFYLGGRIVYVDHGQGVVTAYMHLSKALVAVGDTVQRGQLIGLVGSTGRVTGPHLHWAARYGALNVNPLDLVALGSTTSDTTTHAARPPAPDLLLTGGKVFTADSTHPWAEAVAIRGDRIVAVGTSIELNRLVGPKTRRIALGGRVVVPGFNDAHDHLGAAPFGVYFATGGPQPPEPSASVVLDSLRALVKRVPPGTWVQTTIGPDLVADTAVGRAALDRIAPKHPVMLMAWTGHGMVLNSAALQLLGITDAVRNPLGGTLERDTMGRLTGVLQEYAGWNIVRKLNSALPAATLGRVFRRYADDAVRSGITSVQDMNGYLDPATTLRVLRATPLPIRLRVIPFLLTDSAGLKSDEWQLVDSNPAPRVVVSGVKWIFDGTPLERLALMRTPYADRAGWYGQLEFPADTMRAILARALATRQPLHLHVVGDSTAKLVLDMMQTLAPDSVWRPLRVRFEHGDGVSGDLIPVAKRLGIVVVQNPTHFAFAPGVMQKRFGGTPPGYQGVRSLLAAGIPLALGSDGVNNPFLNIMFATIHPNDPAESLTREQAVTAYTRGSAYAEFAEGEKGTISPGMLADMAVLTQDIFTVPGERLPGTRSVLTLVGGKIVYDGLKRP